MTFILVSPVDHQSLTRCGEMLGTEDGKRRFPIVDGVPHLIDKQRLDAVDAFSAAYGAVRSAEGRRSESRDYYRALPYEDLTGMFESQWRQRASTFDRLLAELGSGPLDVIDAGAGNCWLSARLTAAGHSVLAVDVNADNEDGLGARVNYNESFDVARAELCCIPVMSSSADVVVFNASAHYVVLDDAVREARRILRTGGRIVIADSPVYAEASAGRTMVREMDDYISGLGVVPASYGGRGFLTEDDLAQTELSWHRIAAGEGFLRGLRRRGSRWRAGRELARFPMMIATPNGTHSPRGSGAAGTVI